MANDAQRPDAGFQPAAAGIDDNGSANRAAAGMREVLRLGEQLRDRMLEFEATKQRWNAERDEQVHQLQQESEQLAEAWSRLEAEQRRVLAREATARTLHAGDTDSSEPAPSRAAIAASDDDSSLLGMAARLAASVPSRLDAVRQFQQLNREMRNHSQRLESPR